MLQVPKWQEERQAGHHFGGKYNLAPRRASIQWHIHRHFTKRRRNTLDAQSNRQLKTAINLIYSEWVGFQIRPTLLYKCQFLLLEGGFAAAIGEVCNGSCHINGGKSTDNHTEEHCKCERTDCIATEYENAQQHEQGRA